jgi:hypothetical protein
MLEQLTKRLGGSSFPSLHNPLEPMAFLFQPARKSMTARAVVDANGPVSPPSTSLPFPLKTTPSPNISSASPARSSLQREPFRPASSAIKVPVARRSFDAAATSFPAFQRGGNVAFPALVAAGEEGTERSLLSDSRERRERDLPSSSRHQENRELHVPRSQFAGRAGKAAFPRLHIFGRGGNVIFPTLPRAEEEGTWRSVLSGRPESGEDDVPSSPPLRESVIVTRDSC